MTPPNVSRIAKELRAAHATLSAMLAEGDFDDLDFDVEADMVGLAEKLDTWATALELAGVER